MNKPNLKEINSILQQSSLKRYKYFINKCCDYEKLWGLYDKGWALVQGAENVQAIALWPMKEYAELCRTGNWENYNTESIDVHDFLNEYLNELKANNIQLAIFMTPDDKGIIINSDDLRNDLEAELAKIE